MAIAVIVSVRKMRPVEGYPVADHEPCFVRVVERRSMKLVGMEEDEVAGLQVEGQGRRQLLVAGDIAHPEIALMPFILVAIDGEAVAAPDPADRDPDVDPVVRAVEP